MNITNSQMVTDPLIIMNEPTIDSFDVDNLCTSKYIATI